MHRAPGFAPIDLNSWKRREIFHCFAQAAPTGYSITAEVDVTQMRKARWAGGLKFFPAYLWLTTKCLMEQEAFRVARVDGVLGVF